MRSLLTFAALLPISLIAQSIQPKLVPLPREMRVTLTAKAITAAEIRVSGNDAEDLFAAHELAEMAAAHGTPASANGYRITLLRRSDKAAQRMLAEAHMVWDPAMDREGYVLICSEKGTDVIAATSAGIFYGTTTMEQILDAHLKPVGTIRDWPAMQYRGMDDDLSRGPFPTLEFQKQQIRTFAHFKMNLYSPYLEHTLQYSDNPLAAPPGSSLSRADGRELVAYAAKYHLMVVPEQEAFGHLHHMLKYETYSDLAETPHGHVLAPGVPETLPLIKSWFTQIAQDYPSPFLHIGADETFELGMGRTRSEVDTRGLGPVYGDFLAKIHKTLAPLNRKLLFWGDVATSSPAAVPNIPKDMIAVPWIYWHKDSYDADILPFKNAGIETWVAPGDSNWNVVYPSTDNAFDNIAGFVEAGQRLGSTGMLNTVWNDDGEGLFNMDWYGALFGAAASWQQGVSSAALYQDAFPAVFYGDGSGKLAEAHREVAMAEKLLGNSNALFWMDPWSVSGQNASVKILPNAHEGRLHAERAIILIAQARAESPLTLRNQRAIDGLDLGARKLDFIGMKFQLADEMVQAYAKSSALRGDPKKRAEANDLIDGIDSMNGRMQDLRDGYSALKLQYRDLWLAENKPYWLDNVLVRYDLRIQLWQQRAEALREALSTRPQPGVLPSAKSLGMPTPSM